MSQLEYTLLFDYYGELLTDRQKTCFDLRYNQDLTLAEIGQELGVTRQCVFDNLSRAENLLRNMEEKTGCVRRDLALRKAMQGIAAAVAKLESLSDPLAQSLAREIKGHLQGFEE